jgi:hypothetical protein
LNTYDSSSDIDLFIFCDPEIVPATTRSNIFANIPAISDIQLNYGSPGWTNQWAPQSDKFKLAETRFDLSYNTRDWISSVVHKVTDEGATSISELTFRPYTMLGLLATAIILYDSQNFIQELRSYLYPYPPKLKARLIEDNLAILMDRLNDLRDCAWRDLSPTTFLFHLWVACDTIMTILFAFNEQYDPATKRPEKEMRKFKMMPANFVVRYEKALEGPFDRIGKQRAVEEFEALVMETTQLVNGKPA